jgi:hypothetical protein
MRVLVCVMADPLAGLLTGWVVRAVGLCRQIRQHLVGVYIGRSARNL